MRVKYLNTVFFFGLLITVSAAALYLLSSFAGAIFFAAVLAIVFHPLYRRVRARLGGREKIASLLMCLLITLIVVVPLLGVGAMVAGETNKLLTKVEISNQSLQKAGEYLRSLPVPLPLPTETEIFSQKNLSVATQKIGSFFVSVAQKTYSGIIGAVVGIFVLFFTLFYFFIDGEKIARRLMYLSPLSDKHERLLFRRFSSMTAATLKGTIIVGVIQGALGGAAFYLAGVPSVMIWTVIMTIFAIIPMVGTGIVGFPVATYYLLSGQTGVGLFLAGAFVFISFFDNYLRPIIVGKDTQMHTLLVFFATFGGIMTFGLIGFIIGPIIMALFVTLWEIYAVEFGKQLEEYNA